MQESLIRFREVTCRSLPINIKDDTRSRMWYHCTFCHSVIDFNAGHPVHNRKEVEAVVSAPFLADIPQTAKASVDAHEVVVRARGLDPLSEAFRILRTNLGFMLSQAQDHKIITLTSFNIGAGKTFVSVNLAASLVQTKRKFLYLIWTLEKGK